MALGLRIDARVKTAETRRPCRLDMETRMSRVAPNGSQPRRFVLKIQTVETIQLDIMPDSHRTVGAVVDEIIADSIESKRHPNKITLDLNVPTENPMDI